jgi:hypothetical protein
LAFLSNHLCQDPLEKYFGCQRQRGGTNENPTVESFLKNTEALRVVNSFCIEVLFVETAEAVKAITLTYK